MSVYCNPLNLDYKFQHYRAPYPAHREAADPTLALFKGRYYLFASMCGGFWHSEDLLHWGYHENRKLPIHLYAPDVCPVGDYLYFSASRRSGPGQILRSRDPLSDDFEEISAPFPFWDPHTFHDEGRVYFYWGCSNRRPLYGVEMDPEGMAPLGRKKALIHNRPQSGWERIEGVREPAKNLREKLIHLVLGAKPFIEGAFMSKHENRYYLQYAAPGTELYSYGDGVYLADGPLGPFKVQSHNPFSSKPGGFITGAGHGSTLRDEHGNWWHASTMRISVNATFERRIGLFPCGFDEDGIMFCNQDFADYPCRVPGGRFDPREVKPAWMLLSYGKPAVASTTRPGHSPQWGVDENIRTWWCAAAATPGQWYQVDLQQIYTVHAVQVNFADAAVPKLGISKKEAAGEIGMARYIDLDRALYTRYLLEGSLEGDRWFTLEDKREAETNLCHDLLCFEEGVRVRYVRITGFAFPYASAMAISGLRVFGSGKGERPAPVTVAAHRSGDRDATLEWPGERTAQGYNVRYGIAPDKLYSSWLLYGDACRLHLPFLDAEQEEYYACVDAFNENGITAGITGRLSGR